MITIMVFGRWSVTICHFWTTYRLVSKVTYPDFDPLGLAISFSIPLSPAGLLLMASLSRITMALGDTFEQT
jgi:hypothetical protein